MPTKSRTESPKVGIPRPDRVRRIGPSGFGWLDAGLRRDHWVERLSHTEFAVYAWLCLVADRRGVSWYRPGQMAAVLAVPQDELEAALERLCELDLLAYEPFGRGADHGAYQVLSLPQRDLGER